MDDASVKKSLALQERGVLALERIAKVMDKQEAAAPLAPESQKVPKPQVGPGAPEFVSSVLASMGSAPPAPPAA